MLRVNKLTDYATEILSFLAKSPEDSKSAVEIAESLKIARPTVSKILKHLLRGALLSSQRGAGGGYKLAKPSKDISVAEIITVMEGRVAMTDCSIKDGMCEHEAVCTVRLNWQKINTAILTALSNVPLSEMSSESMQTPEFTLHDWRGKTCGSAAKNT